MFGFGNRHVAVQERAGKVRLLVAMLSSNLYSKTPDEFVKFYEAHTVVERNESAINFGIQFSPSCWYDVQACYPEAESEWINEMLRMPGQLEQDRRPSMTVMGGGDDYGVVIALLPGGEQGASVELYTSPGRHVGRDAKAMVTALLGLPGFKRPLNFI